MSKDYSIDSHKLIYHIEKVNSWLNGESIYPIYIEVSPSGGCNHRCIFCGLDYLKHTPSFLPVKAFEEFILDAAKGGVKSILISGAGEPLLNNNSSHFIKFTKDHNIDVALASNATLLTKDISTKTLKYLSWLRISLDAGCAKTYALIHNTYPEQFNEVLANISQAVKIKKANRYKVAIGIQFLLLQENQKETIKAINIAKKLGVDYISFKPYSQHPLSKNSAGKNVDYSKLLKLQNHLNSFSNDFLKIIFRSRAIQRKLTKKPYKQCLGLPFFAYINSDGEVYPCNTFVGIKKLSFGNITNQRFKTIWEGNKRDKIMRGFFRKMDARECREACRLDEINTYLWNLKNPPDHVNFI